LTTEKILIVEDEPEALRMLELFLKSNFYTVITAQNSKDGLRLLYENQPELAILDIELIGDDLTGFDICQRIREISDIPIIMLTGIDDPNYVIRCLEAGADDYITKPYNKNVLLARVRSNLRRANNIIMKELNNTIYEDDFLMINLLERRVLCDSEPVKLSPTEFNLLSALLENSPRVVEYSSLLLKVWGREYVDDVDYLRVYIWHLRRKIEQNPKDPIYLINEIGVGYRFEKQ